MQTGGCGGDTWSLLGAETPDFVALLTLLEIEVLWHPSLSRRKPREFRKMVDSLTSGKRELDFLVLEGAIVRGPGGTGMYDTINRQPKKEHQRPSAPATSWHSQV